MRLWPLLLLYLLFALAVYFGACEWKRQQEPPARKPLDWNDLSDRLI